MSSTSRRGWRGRAVAAAAGLWLGSWLGLAAALAGEEIPVGELPDEVVRAITARFVEPELLEAEREHEDGVLLYEVKVLSEGRIHEVEVTEDGVISEVDRELAVGARRG